MIEKFIKNVVLKIFGVDATEASFIVNCGDGRWNDQGPPRRELRRLEEVARTHVETTH